MRLASPFSLLQNRKGNIAIIFALCAPVLVAGTGIAVDMSRLFASDLNVQKSLDAAALAAAKEFGKTQDPVALKKIAEAYFYLNAGRDPAQQTRFRFDGVHIENGNAVMKVSATRTVPMYFGPFVMAFYGGADKHSYDLVKSSEIVVQNRSIEMALVLDNSGSMKSAPVGGSTPKITTLKSATTTLVNQMMAATNANVQYPVSMSVVPFSGAVNIGTANATATWMDTKGYSPSHHDDFDWSTWKSSLGIPQAIRVSLGSRTSWTTLTGVPLTRFSLYSRIGKAWDGCVQSRPNGYAITDDAPTEVNPATLFVPTFAPSEHNWTGALASLKNDYYPDKGASTNGQSDLEALRKQRDMNKYFSGASYNSNAGGPNQVCNTKPLTPLTKSQSTVLSAISGMEPVGGTNIMEGLAWGWRTLSSRLPFAEGKPPRTEDNLKIVVLMTDGENTYNASYSNGDQVDMPNGGRSMYGTYGYAQFVEKDILGNETLRTGRMFDSTKKTVKKADIDNVTDAMNENMSSVCENMKSDGRNADGSDGIVIFTIAFDLKDGSPVKERLRACASSGVNGQGAKLYYDAKSSSDLTAAFSSITEEISSLRIAR